MLGGFPSSWDPGQQLSVFGVWKAEMRCAALIDSPERQLEQEAHSPHRWGPVALLQVGGRSFILSDILRVSAAPG